MCTKGLFSLSESVLVWPPFASRSATHLLHIELIRLLIVTCVMLVHSSSMFVWSCWILAGTGTRCRIRRSRASQTCHTMGDMSSEYEFGYANRLLQHLSGWLVSGDLGGEDAGCGGPGLVWLTWSVVVRPVGCTAKFSETPLEMAYGREMNIKFTGNIWWTFLQSACQLHAPSKLAESVALCCVIKLHILEWPFIAASLRHTCVIIMLSNHHLDMPHLWGEWRSVH